MAQPKRPRNRRRWVVLALSITALGAVSNYAIVWGIIRFGPPGWRQSVNMGTGRIDAPDYTFTVNGLRHEVLEDHSAWGIETSVKVITDPNPVYTRPPIVLETPQPWMVVPSTLHRRGDRWGEGAQSTTSRTWAYGLPFVCLMRTEGVLHDQTGEARLWREAFWEIETESGGTRYEFPLMPVWDGFRGFAGNTALFAAAWLAAILLVILPLCRATACAWNWLKRRSEAGNRGKCIKCGYPRAGLPEPHSPCPECGSRQF